jgi:glycerol-3-phosphate acyltransferase PlsY
MSGFILIVIIAYLLGSIPFGMITATQRGVDIRKYGSGNIGTTNVLRTLGAKAAVITLIGDILKGTLAVLIMKGFQGTEIWIALAGLAAIIGHNWPVFLKFKGGKGVATSFGVFLGIWPLVALVGAGIWLTVVSIWRYSSLGALVSFLCLPFLIYKFNGPDPYIGLSVLVAILIVYRHCDNIKRLWQGTESKIGQKVKV